MILPQQRRRAASAVRAGFTLMEMMVVVAILVVLVGVAVPIYIRYLDDSKKSAARASVENLAKTVELYYTKNGQWPSGWDQLTGQGQDGSPPVLKAKGIDSK